MLTFIHLVTEFFKIGLFSIGGGYATMPFLYQLVYTYGWYTTSDLTNMIAISVITPGPVGANMATFAGFKTLSQLGLLQGIVGGVCATLALVLPSYLIVIFVSKLLKTFRENFFVKSILYSLKPVGCGLLTAVCFGLIRDYVTNVPAVWLLLFLFLLSFKFKKNPLFYFIFGAVMGVVLHLCHVDLSNSFSLFSI